MGLNWPKAGIYNVGEFQVSGHILPITGSGNVVKLKYVASGITISNATATAQNAEFFGGPGEGEVFPVPPNTSIRVKCKISFV